MSSIIARNNLERHAHTLWEEEEEAFLIEINCRSIEVKNSFLSRAPVRATRPCRRAQSAKRKCPRSQTILDHACACRFLRSNPVTRDLRTA